MLRYERVKRVGEFSAMLLARDCGIECLQRGLRIVEMQSDAISGVCRQLRLDTLFKAMYGVEHATWLRVRSGDKHTANTEQQDRSDAANPHEPSRARRPSPARRRR